MVIDWLTVEENEAGGRTVLLRNAEDEKAPSAPFARVQTARA
jgi:hypothetical protein